MARAFASHCQLKESQETHSASRDPDPSDSSCTLHWASLVSLTLPLILLSHAILLRGAGRSWHESCQHRGSGSCRALQLPRAGQEHVLSQPWLCVCLGKNAQRWMPGLGSPQAGRGGSWGGAATPGCLWWHQHHCPQIPGMVQRGSCAGTARTCSPGRALGALPALAHANCM